MDVVSKIVCFSKKWVFWVFVRRGGQILNSTFQHALVFYKSIEDQRSVGKEPISEVASVVSVILSGHCLPVLLRRWTPLAECDVILHHTPALPVRHAHQFLYLQKELVLFNLSTEVNSWLITGARPREGENP